jgi:hypothetical protein
MVMLVSHLKRVTVRKELGRLIRCFQLGSKAQRDSKEENKASHNVVSIINDKRGIALVEQLLNSSVLIDVNTYKAPMNA